MRPVEFGTEEGRQVAEFDHYEHHLPREGERVVLDDTNYRVVDVVHHPDDRGWITVTLERVRRVDTEGDR